MKVKELIALLQAQDPEIEVRYAAVQDTGHGGGVIVESPIAASYVGEFAIKSHPAYGQKQFILTDASFDPVTGA